MSGPSSTTPADDARVADQAGRDARDRRAATWDADQAVTELYAAHYASLVRLGTLVLHDAAVAEEVVQDAFVAMHKRWGRLRDPDKALAYLRQSVVNGGRSVLRRRAVATKHLPTLWDSAVEPSAEHGALARTDRDDLMAALRELPRRQREVLVLRYYNDLSEAEIADTLGISRGAVKSHASRGMTALRGTVRGDR